EPFSIQRKITEEDFPYSVMRIRSSMTDVQVSVDGQEIFSFNISDNASWFHAPYPSTWHLVDIPVSENLGRNLRITFSSPTREFTGYVNPIMIGRGEALILDIFYSRVANFVISALLAFLSITAFALAPWMKDPAIRKHSIYLASFALVASVWILSESTLLQFFTPNRIIIASTSYILNLIMPLILVLFFRDIVLTGYKRTMTLFVHILQALLLVEILLQITGVLSFIASTIFSIIAITGFSLFLIYALAQEGYRKGNEVARRYLRIFLILFVFVCIIIAAFFIQAYNELSSYLATGVLLFYILILRESFKTIGSLIEHKNMTTIYKRMAFEDHLTQGNNRSAFERDIIRHQRERNTFRLVLLDLNNLKGINDTYGHAEGDYAIVESYRSLVEALGEKGTAYRISGDEFACVMQDLDIDAYRRFTEEVNEYLKKKSEQKPFDLVLAFGTRVYDHNTEFNDFYRSVDIQMYEHKKQLKAVM
ncbi:MAG: diguanylate cyclase, partial [Sphaerochaetaceae bacterium]|nr:diguanylate cyclase [Sphaerochaetaceae bacterium]